MPQTPSDVGPRREALEAQRPGQSPAGAPSCERCKALEGYLQRERQELAKLRASVARLSDRAKERKQLLDKVVTGEVTAAKAADQAVSAVITHLILRTPENISEYMKSHSMMIRNVGREVLDRFKNDDHKFKYRNSAEHSMPRHGRQSS
jgi:hypothetical protein